MLINRGEGRFDSASRLSVRRRRRSRLRFRKRDELVVWKQEDEPEESREAKPASPESFPVVHFGDLDGDGVAEYVTEEGLEDEDAGWRKEVKEAKRPPRRYRIHRSQPDLGIDPDPFQVFEALGYALDLSDSDIKLPGGFQDLDGDGRQDLITLTLDFSLFQAVTNHDHAADRHRARFPCLLPGRRWRFHGSARDGSFGKVQDQLEEPAGGTALPVRRATSTATAASISCRSAAGKR